MLLVCGMILSFKGSCISCVHADGYCGCCVSCMPLHRYGVLQEMLEMVRDHQNNQHMSRLEWIVIWLIAVAVSGGLQLGKGNDSMAAYT